VNLADAGDVARSGQVPALRPRKRPAMEMKAMRDDLSQAKEEHQMNDHSPSEGRRTTTADLSWMLWTAIGIGGIWIAVLLISLLAPDLVSGSEQQHLPVAAFATGFWGGIGTLVFLWAMGRLRGRAMWRPTWTGLSVVTLGIWAVATILAITLPVMVTGTDPTRIPFAALFAPPAAAMLTALAGTIASVFRGGPGGG
jgi:hypothetical protein